MAHEANRMQYHARPYMFRSAVHRPRVKGARELTRDRAAVEAYDSAMDAATRLALRHCMESLACKPKAQFDPADL